MKPALIPAWILSACCMMVSLSSCKQSPADTEAHPLHARVTPPDWSYDANIYEVNIRQYTPECTFDAFREHLPRLKAMGVDILWLMPVHPISVPSGRERWAATMPSRTSAPSTRNTGRWRTSVSWSIPSMPSGCM